MGAAEGLASRFAGPLRMAALAVAGIVVLAQFFGAFVGLEASSLWVDELYSLWSIAPPTWGQALDRMLGDTHPPAYYLTLRAWTLAFGAGDAAIRALSAASAVAAICVLFFGTKRRLSLEARVIAALVGVSSIIWIGQAQNARMYALGLLMAAVVCVVALSLAARASEGRLRWRDHAALLAIGLAASFTHLYLFLMMGAVYAALILIARRWKDRLALAACGAGIFVCMALFVHGMVGRALVDIHNLWFRNSLEVFATEIRNSFYQQVGRSLLLVAAVGAVAVLVRRRAAMATLEGREHLRALALLVAIPVTLIAAGVAISLLMAPSFSYRNLAVAAPALWLAAGVLYDLAVGPLPRPWRVAPFGALVILAALSGREILDRQTPVREEWRNSAAYVASVGACDARAIPIGSVFHGKLTPPIWAMTRNAYRHYLPAPDAHPMLGVQIEPGAAYRLQAGTERILAARLSGEDPCPILLWAVHSPSDEAALRAAIRQAAAVPHGRIGVRRFTHVNTRQGRMDSGALVLLAEPPAPAGR